MARFVLGIRVEVPMLPPLVLITDPEGNVLHANAPAAALLGTCEGRHCCDVLQTECGASEGYEDLGSVSMNGVHGHASRSSVGDQFAFVVHPKCVHAKVMEPLSPRETEVLRHVARGLTDAEVAARLGIGAATARSYMQSVREKLGVRTRSQAVALALGTGLI